MQETTIGTDDAASVSELLTAIGGSREAPAEIRDASRYWASEVRPDMEPGDLQTVAWLLRDASASRAVAAPRRDQARYWAAYLEGRMQAVAARLAAAAIPSAEYATATRDRRAWRPRMVS